MKIFVLPNVIGNDLSFRPFVIATDTLSEAIEIVEKELSRKLTSSQKVVYEMEFSSGNQFSMEFPR